MAVRSGTFDVDPDAGVGTLVLELGSSGEGSLRGVASRAVSEATGIAVWTVRGTLKFEHRSTSVTLTLRDHGVFRRANTWWWLTGTGGTPRCGRQRRVHHGAPLVADLLLTR